LAHHLNLPPEFHVMRTCCGTPHYVAPEVLSENQYSVQADFWSLGVILYVMLSGQQPFNSQSIRAMYGMIIRGQYCFPSPCWDRVSESAKDCIRSLMCVDPKTRLNCERLLKHEFIQNNVDVEELVQEEKSFLHQQELKYSFEGNNTLEMETPHDKDNNLSQEKISSFHHNLGTSSTTNNT